MTEKASTFKQRSQDDKFLTRINDSFALGLSLFVVSDHHDIVRHVGFLVGHHMFVFGPVHDFHDRPAGAVAHVLSTIFDLVAEILTVVFDRRHRVPFDHQVVRTGACNDRKFCKRMKTELTCRGKQMFLSLFL